MTLDDAIKHAEEKAETSTCTECADKHQQLAKWLRELKAYREEQEQEIASYKETRRAIKSFAGRS